MRKFLDLIFLKDQRGAFLAEALAAMSVFTLLGTAVMTSVSATGAASESIRVSATADTLASNQIQEILSAPYVDPPFTFTPISAPTGYSLTAVAEEFVPGDTNISKIVVMVTAVSEVETAVEAMRLGANDYVMKPFVLRDMLVTVDHAIESVSLEANAIETDFDVEDAPLTIAIGTPLEQNQATDVDREELGRIAEDIMIIQDQLGRLLNRVDALSQPRIKSVASLSGGWRPDGDAA